MRVTVIGVGGLGGAIARGLLAAGLDVTLCDRHPEKAPLFPGAAFVASPAVAVRRADVVLLAVKPLGTSALLAEIQPALLAEALVISCAAAVPVALLPSPNAIARAMPSIGAAAGASTTGVFLGPGCVATRDWPRLQAVLGPLGPIHRVHDEELMHVVTAIGASAPAFLLLAVEALESHGIAAGLPQLEARAYAVGALRAASERLKGGEGPAALRAQVTSPNGTTAAGLAALAQHAFTGALDDACAAAVGRSKERQAELLAAAAAGLK